VKSGPGWPISGQGWAIGLLTAVSLEEFRRDFQRNCGEMRRKSLNFGASFSLHHGTVNGRNRRFSRPLPLSQPHHAVWAQHCSPPHCRRIVRRIPPVQIDGKRNLFLIADSHHLTRNTWNRLAIRRRAKTAPGRILQETTPDTLLTPFSLSRFLRSTRRTYWLEWFSCATILD
jgi:hypothetical protein